MLERTFKKLGNFFDPEWLRTHFDDSQRFLIVSIVCGVLCGLAAVAFHHAIEFIFHNVWHFASEQDPITFTLVLLIAPTVGGLIVGIAVKNFAPGAAGSGIPQTKTAFFNKKGHISVYEGTWRFFLGSLYVGLGNSLGREGPTIHVCSSIASKLGRIFFTTSARKQAILPVGMAAGISAAFNSPISAITFVFEELLDKFTTKAIGSMMIAVQAILVSRAWVKENKTVPMWSKAAIGGLCAGIFGVSAYFLTQISTPGHAGENGVFSIGYESLEHAFEGHLFLRVLIVLFVFKTLAVIAGYATGGSGGLFSPTLFIGGMLGGIIGTILTLMDVSDQATNSEIIGGCVLLGMGAMFGSVIRCPFTSLFMIFELTGNYTLILPLMFGNILSWQIAKKLGSVSLYNALLIQDKINIRQFPSYRGSQDYRNLLQTSTQVIRRSGYKIPRVPCHRQRRPIQRFSDAS